MATPITMLFYNRMFGADLGLDVIDLPRGFELTEDRSRFADAAAVVFHLPDLPRPFLRRKASGQLWVAWSMECAAHYRHLRSAGFLRRFDLTMTYRRDADVCVPYIPDNLFDPLPETPPKSSERLICSVVSGPRDRSGRGRYLRELARHLDLHTYGRKGDRTITDDTGRVSKLALCSAYKFTIAFENAIATDYVTEKFFDPLVAGSVPVYLGAPNVENFAPADDCFIDTAKFSGPAELARHLLELDRDDDAYRHLLDWRSRSPRASLERFLQDMRVHPFVRLCQIVAERAGQSPG